MVPPFPPNAGLVKTASGGFHVYFSGEGIDLKTLPSAFDLGQGCLGEIRKSAGGMALLVLPGSRVTNKRGKIALYEEVQPIVPSALCSPPPLLVKRLVARPERQPARHGDTMPTEAYHALRFIERMGIVKEGEMNVVIAQVGQLIGRLCPQTTPSDGIMKELWNALSPRLETPPFDPEDPEKQKLFRSAMKSGWKKGHDNRVKYDHKDPIPSVSDVRAECEALFGASPWLQEMRGPDGKVIELRLGLGGSAKRPNDVQQSASIDSMNDILPALTRIGRADEDTVALCPLFVQGGWGKTLRFMLQAGKEVTYISASPEDRLWSMLTIRLHEALAARAFTRTFNEKRDVPSACFLVYKSAQAYLVVPSADEQEFLLTHSGDVGKAKSVVKRVSLDKNLRGTSSRQRAWAISLSYFDESDTLLANEAYEAWVRDDETRTTK